MTGIPIQDSGDGIWDDGEWISWSYINEQIEKSEAQHKQQRAPQKKKPSPAPQAAPGQKKQKQPKPVGGMVEDMIVLAKRYQKETSRHLPIYGELGEYYASRRFGIELHKDPKAQGSDGHIGNSLVEIKTISPLRDTRHVSVKKSGNFGFLAIVKIDANFNIDAKLIERKKLPKTNDTHYVVSWDDYSSESP
jgi:hypothetical protein